MASAALVYIEPWEVTKHLAELGLTEEILIYAAERGFIAWASCTPNHPPAIPGLWSWGETMCGLGDGLKPLGWERKNESNWPFVVNEKGTIALSVATGNEDTGRDSEREPLTTSAKGPRTVEAIVSNKKQLALFTEPLPTREALKTPTRATWLLLVHRDLQAREMRCELSRPISMDDEGHVDGWAERIILSPRPFDGIGDALIGDSNAPQSQELQVEIKRRA